MFPRLTRLNEYDVSTEIVYSITQLYLVVYCYLQPGGKGWRYRNIAKDTQEDCHLSRSKDDDSNYDICNREAHKKPTAD